MEAHGGNVTLNSSIFLMVAAQSVSVEAALSQGFFKPGALHLVHVDRPDPYGETQQAHKKCVTV